MKEFLYTSNGKEELSKFLNHQQNRLEEIIKSDKFVFGDEIIEITASDIIEASKYFKIENYHQSRKLYLRKFVISAYFILGIVVTVIGIFYQYFIHIVRNNPTQLMFIAMGLLLVMLSFMMNIFFKLKDNKNNHYLEEKINSIKSK